MDLQHPTVSPHSADFFSPVSFFLLQYSASVQLSVCVCAGAGAHEGVCLPQMKMEKMKGPGTALFAAGSA